MTRLTVAGSMNLDLVVPVGHLPVPGETVLGSDVSYRAGGKGANQAVAARRLGADVTLLAARGGDHFGADLRDRLAAEGVDISGVVNMPDAATGLALIVVRPDGENTITVAPGANGLLREEHLGDLRAELTRSDAVLLQLEIPTDTDLAVARAAATTSTLTVLNAAPLSPPDHTDSLTELLAAVDVLVVNEIEAFRLSDQRPSEPADWARLAATMCELGPSVVVITLGERGAVGASGGSPSIQPGFEVKAIDRTGAGDAFCSALAVALAEGSGVKEAMRRACATGALAITQLGAQSAFPSTREVNHLLREANRSGEIDAS